jgi:hypothetical protein
MGKKYGSGMKNPDNFCERFETVFWVEIFKFFDAETGWEKFGSGSEQIWIRDEHPGLQHCKLQN